MQSFVYACLVAIVMANAAALLVVVANLSRTFQANAATFGIAVGVTAFIVTYAIS